MDMMKKGVRAVLLVLLVLISGCAALPPLFEEKPLITPEEIPPAVRQIYHSAEGAYAAGRNEEALALYGQILQQVHEGSAAAMLSLTRRGELFARRGNNSGSAEELLRVKKRFDDDPLYHEARFFLARSYTKLGAYDASITVIEELMGERIPSYRKTELYSLMGDNRLGANESYNALDFYMKALKRRPQQQDLRDYITTRIEYIIDSGLTLEELKMARDTYRFGYPSGYLLFSLAKHYYENHEIKEAQAFLDLFIRWNKEHPYFEEACKLRERFEEMMLIDRHALGCLLPLTGRFAMYGNRALEAIVMASGVFDSESDSPVTIVVEDTKSDPETAGRAVARLCNDDKVIGILGPLGSATSTEAAEEAQRLRIPLLTLTQKEGITEIGDYVFRNFLTAEMQVRTLVKYSVQNLGMMSFAVLYPDDEYGKKMMNLFWNEVKRWGGEVRGIEAYSVEQTDFSKEIKELAGLTDQEKKTDDDQLRPVLDFDALFIPDSWVRVSMIAPQLAFYDVTGVQLLGTNAWNSPKLLERDSEYLEGAIFVDGFFRNSYYPVVREFIDLFYRSYGREPKDMEALTYDAARIMVDVLVRDDVEVRDDVRNGILQIRDYRGITGKTSFVETRDAEKSLSVLMVRGSEIIQID